MGQLSADRVQATPPLTIMGLDFTGPFLCKRGNPRKPTFVKTYACLYVCFITKSVHLELVSDLTSNAFLACFCCFTGRRGCPAVVCSDNGTNFKGAWAEQIQELVAPRPHKTSCIIMPFPIRSTASSRPAELYFGGLWEAGVKSM